MPHPCADLETQLCAALRAKTAADRRSLAALESLRARLQAGEALPDACTDLQTLLQDVNRADASVGQLRAAWNSAGQSAGAALQAELQEQRAVLESLMALMGAIHADAAALKERLAPQLDAAARGSQMRAAYAVAGRHA